VAPALTLISVSMIGSAGRVYIAGETSDIVLAREEIDRVLNAVAGREH
jgi:cation transport ATPase